MATKPARASSTATEWDRDAALTAARILLEIKAVNFRPEEPYTFTAGWKSPVYIDCRRIIYFPRARAKISDLAVEKIDRHVGYENIEVVAGGETAGIPFAAFIADRMNAPMAYVRKKPKGFGRGSQIEGQMLPGQRVLLVEDLATDGRSKINFVNAIRDAGGSCDHCTVLFFYDIYPEGRKILADIGVTLHYLTTWHDVLRVAKASGKFEPKMLAEVENFINDPAGWSKAHGGVATAAE